MRLPSPGMTRYSGSVESWGCTCKYWREGFRINKDRDRAQAARLLSYMLDCCFALLGLMALGDLVVRPFSSPRPRLRPLPNMVALGSSTSASGSLRLWCDLRVLAWSSSWALMISASASSIKDTTMQDLGNSFRSALRAALPSLSGLLTAQARPGGSPTALQG